MNIDHVLSTIDTFHISNLRSYVEMATRVDLPEALVQSVDVWKRRLFKEIIQADIDGRLIDFRFESFFRPELVWRAWNESTRINGFTVILETNGTRKDPETGCQVISYVILGYQEIE